MPTVSAASPKASPKRWSSSAATSSRCGWDRFEAKRTSQDFEQRVSRFAYLLWQEAGRPKGQDKTFWTIAVAQEEYGEPPAADISAVLTVIKRRTELNLIRERIEGWRFDFTDAVLRHASLPGVHLARASLSSAHLERANLMGAHLEGAHLINAYLQGAHLFGAHLDEAFLSGAHLEGTNLSDTYLKGVDLAVTTHGDARTRLPPGMARPAHWPPSGTA